jgi:Chromosome segregation ATPases
MKLEKARARREELHRIREIRVMDKHHQAIQRAQQNIQYQKERLQEKTSKVAHVIARRHLLEETYRDRILVSLENKLNDAIHRAEEISKRKQIKARNIRRAEKAKKRRVLLEYERRSAVLSIMDKRSEMAQKNVELLMKDRQIKAREEIEHAQLVSRRVKAAKILQRTVRGMLGMKDSSTREGAAAIQIQCWAWWRIQVVSRRLLSLDEESLSPLDCLKSILCRMGYSNSSDSGLSCVQHPSPSFEDLTMEMNRDEMLASTKRFLLTLDPIMGSRTCVSERTFLTAFLVTQQPNEVIGPKRGKDHCSRILEQSSHRLVKSLVNLSNGVVHGTENSSDWTALVTRAASCILSYCTIFEIWKNADIHDLIAQMAESASQSWIAYTIAKEVLSYIEEKENDILIRTTGDPFFQHKIRYKSSKKGAYSHIRRIRVSIDKLLGAEKGFRAMKDARKNAMDRIQENNLLQKSKQEIDHVCSQGMQDESSYSDGVKPEFDLHDAAALDDINEQLVHEILLADDGDIKEQLCREPMSSIVDCVDTFMDKFKNGFFDDSTTSDVGTFAFTMEKAFFDQIRDTWFVEDDMAGVKEVLVEILSKMRKLVPSRKDLHVHFSSIHVDNCDGAVEVLSLLLRLAKVLGDLLESPFRAKSTLDWYQTAAHFHEGKIEVPFEFDDVKSYIVASLAFLVKKLDLCHADVIHFRLGKLTPVIKTNGIAYERSRFHKKYGTSTTVLQATKAWMERLKPEIIDCSPGLSATVKKGFVDELLFIKERIAMPEILCLDAARISSIRDRAQKIVLISSLLLLMCNIISFQISYFESDELKGKVKVHKNILLRTLRNYASFEDLCDRSTQVILTFAEGKLERELQIITVKEMCLTPSLRTFLGLP